MTDANIPAFRPLRRSLTLSLIHIYAPGAKLINFTNPSGIITEAVARYTDVPVVGLCNCPITAFMRTKKHMGWENDDVFFDYFGLNHLCLLYTSRCV